MLQVIEYCRFAWKRRNQRGRGRVLYFRPIFGYVSADLESTESFAFCRHTAQMWQGSKTSYLSGKWGFAKSFTSITSSGSIICDGSQCDTKCLGSGISFSCFLFKEGFHLKRYALEVNVCPWDKTAPHLWLQGVCSPLWTEAILCWKLLVAAAGLELFVGERNNHKSCLEKCCHLFLHPLVCNTSSHGKCGLFFFFLHFHRGIVTGKCLAAARKWVFVSSCTQKYLLLSWWL